MKYSPAIQNILDSKHGVSPEAIKKLSRDDVATLFNGLKNGTLEEYRGKISEVIIQAIPNEATPYFLAEAANTELPADTRAAAVSLLARYAGKTVTAQLSALLSEPGLPEIVAQKILIGLNRIGDKTVAAVVQAFMNHQKLGETARLGFNVMQADDMHDFSTAEKNTAPLSTTIPMKDIALRRISLAKDKIVLAANESGGIKLGDNAFAYTCAGRDFILAFNADIARLDNRKSMVAGILFYKKRFQDAYESSLVILAIQSGSKQYKLSVQTFDGRSLHAGTINGTDFEIYALSGVPNSPIKITGKLVKGEPTFTTFQSGEQTTGRNAPSVLPRSFMK